MAAAGGAGFAAGGLAFGVSCTTVGPAWATEVKPSPAAKPSEPRSPPKLMTGGGKSDKEAGTFSIRVRVNMEVASYPAPPPQVNLCKKLGEHGII